MTDDSGDTETATGQSEDEPRILPTEATDEDVEFNTAYRATVNETVYYGVFVTLAGTYPDDVSGLAHWSNLPAGFGSEDFTAGDTLAVQLRERSAKGLSFEVLELLERARGVNEVGGAPAQDYSLTEDEPGPKEQQTVPAATAPSQAELDAITARLDTIKASVGMDAPTVRARVVDVGDDATLLRVLDSGSAMDVNHGEVVTVRLRGTGSHETEDSLDA